MALSQDELNAIVTVVQSRLDTMKAEIMAEVYTAVEAQRQDFYAAIQQLGQNQTNLYEYMTTRLDPGMLSVEVHDFWTRSVLAEAERIRRGIEADIAVNAEPPFFSDEEPAEEEVAEVPSVPSPKVKSKPVVEG